MQKYYPVKTVKFVGLICLHYLLLNPKLGISSIERAASFCMLLATHSTFPDFCLCCELEYYEMNEEVTKNEKKPSHSELINPAWTHVPYAFNASTVLYYS